MCLRMINIKPCWDNDAHSKVEPNNQGSNCHADPKTHRCRCSCLIHVGLLLIEFPRRPVAVLDGPDVT